MAENCATGTCTRRRKPSREERDKLRVMISKKCCFQPLPEPIGGLNRHLKGWSSYIRAGYNRAAFRQINAQVGKCLARHLRRRSQPRMAPRNGTSVYAHLQQLGLIYL